MIQNHKAKHCVRIVGTLATLVLGLELSVLPAQAILRVQIAGAGSGSTTWTFSGSDTAGGSGVFTSESQIVNGVWQDLGDFTDLNVFDVPGDGGSILGSATITIEAASRAVDSVFIDDDGGLGDDFAIGVEGDSDFDFSEGDLVSWTGSLTVTGIDLNDVDNTPLPATLTSSTYGDLVSGKPGILDLELTIVPEPTTLALMGLGLLGAFVAGRRKMAA